MEVDLERRRRGGEEMGDGVEKRWVEGRGDGTEVTEWRRDGWRAEATEWRTDGDGVNFGGRSGEEAEHAEGEN